MAATREGPRRLTSTAVSRGESRSNSGARMDHGRTTRKKFSASIVQAEAVNTDIAGYREDPPGCLFGEAGAELLAEAVEAVIAEHVPVHALLGPSPAGAYEEHDLGVRQAAQHPLGQGGAQEARSPVIAMRRPASASLSIPRVYHACLATPRDDPATRAGR